MIDRSLALLREGFLFILRRRRKKGADIFTTRLLLKKSVCMGGREAARLFYDPDCFQRAEAVPGFVQDTLFGRDAVQTKDGAEHRHRKALFLELTNERSAERFTALLASEWNRRQISWKYSEKPIVLLTQSQEILCRAICAWGGIALPDYEVRPRSRDLFSMIDAFGSVMGWRHWRGFFARRRMEKWMTDLVEKARRGKLGMPESPLNIVAHYYGFDGVLLPAKMAAIEVLNIIRPTVAISYYISFAALALHEYPECRNKILSIDGYLDMFINEVRRYYPFAPFLGAKATKDFSVQGCPLAKNELAVLDLYGTNHDEKIWDKSETFQPERFQGWQDDGYSLIPQGGGDAAAGHRCPGEGFTIAALRVALSALVSFRYTLPSQDLGFSLSRMPTYPRSGIIIRPA